MGPMGLSMAGYLLMLIINIQAYCSIHIPMCFLAETTSEKAPVTLLPRGKFPAYLFLSGK